MSEGFICTICTKRVGDEPWRQGRGPSMEVPPICCLCERTSGYDWAGRARYRTRPTGGAFMDRRNATRVLALSEELASLAKRIEWSNRHVR